MPNQYYNLYNFGKLPLHILQAESTLCITFNFYERCYVRVFPISPDSFIEARARSISLIDPTEADLTYLTLLGVRHCLETQDSIVNIYNAIVETGTFKVTIIK